MGARSKYTPSWHAVSATVLQKIVRWGGLAKAIPGWEASCKMATSEKANQK